MQEVKVSLPAVTGTACNKKLNSLVVVHAQQLLVSSQGFCLYVTYAMTYALSLDK